MAEPEGANEVESDLGEMVDRALGILVRRRWWIGLPACAIALGTVVGVMKLPNRYTSEAVLIMQQRVLRRYVLPPDAMGNGVVVQAVTRQVLSSANLITIMNEFGLYAGDEKRKRPAPGTLVALMRRDLDIEALDSGAQADANTFKISYTAGSPQIAQAVASRLTQLFIDINLKTRENQAASTSQFLSEQLAAARRKLSEQEQRLRDFKARFPAELPEQQEGNIAALTELRIQLQSIRSSRSRAQQQRASLESSLGSSLERLQSEKATLLARYTERHAEVVRKVADIASVEGALKNLRAATAESASLRRLPRPSEPALSELVAQIEANTREIADLLRQEAQLKSEIAQYQSRLNLTPSRQQELASILRDYEVFRNQYADLLSKQQQSQVQTNLEESGESLQFRLVDPPSLPDKPSAPKRLKLTLGGLAGGIFVGLALGFLRDSRDRSFYCEKDLTQRFPVSIVCGVPMLPTPAEQRLKRFRLVSEWVVGCIAAAGVIAADLYIFLNR